MRARDLLLLAGDARWTPANFFASGALGAWFEPSSASKFFIESTGQTQVANDADPIGLAFDRSLAVSPEGELNPDTGFDSAGSWTLPTGFSISASALHLASPTNFTSATINVAAVAIGSVLKMVHTIANWTSGYVAASPSGGPAGVSRNVNGTHTDYVITAAALTTINMQARAVGTVLDVNNLSAVRIAAAGGLQATGGARPKWHVSNLEFDGVDDALVTGTKPTTAGTLIFVGTMAAASDVAMGSRAASNGYAYLGTDASGRICGAVGTESFSTIHGTTDIRGLRGVYALRWNGSTVKLNRGGAIEYEGAQSGAVNTTIAIMLGALNNNGVAANWASLSGEAFLVFNQSLSDADLAKLVNFYGG